jgi:glycerol-3-phosphate cytidylyltransferase-like family protein
MEKIYTSFRKIGKFIIFTGVFSLCVGLSPRSQNTNNISNVYTTIVKADTDTVKQEPIQESESSKKAVSESTLQEKTVEGADYKTSSALVKKASVKSVLPQNDSSFGKEQSGSIQENVINVRTKMK